MLVVDDNASVRGYIADLLQKDGWEVDTADTGRHALELLDAGASPDVVLLDLALPGLDGLATLDRIRATFEHLPVVMVSVAGSAHKIVESMKRGASDYLTKPFDEGALTTVLNRSLESRSEVRDGVPARPAVQGETSKTWQSAAMREIRNTVEQISDTNVTVLIQGESGVGKEVVARQIHESSTRSEGPFVKVNCAALPSELLESELFGYEAGAFTGANSRKVGRFELADGGTIFLDEIAEMSPGLQAKLLQVLQDSEFSRLGSNGEIRVDIRIVCATHRSLDQLVQEKRFREDLYFRLNVVGIHIPPLRDRIDEALQLAESSLRRFCEHYAKPYIPPSERLVEALRRYDFPGNVRELENLMKRIAIFGSEEPVLRELAASNGAGEMTGLTALSELLEEIEATAGELPLKEVGRRVALEAERDAIARMLRRTDWNRKKAAKFLNVSYKTLLQKIRECGLEPEG